MTPHPKVSEIFGVARAARDAAVDLVVERVEAHHPIAGWEVDKAARTVITDAGFGDRFIHRTGSQPRGRGSRQRRPHGRL